MIVMENFGSRIFLYIPQIQTPIAEKLPLRKADMDELAALHDRRAMCPPTDEEAINLRRHSSSASNDVMYLSDLRSDFFLSSCTRASHGLDLR